MLAWGLAAASAAASAAVTGCGARELPPLGEVLVVVDTDLPVPRVVSELRVDVYGEDGAWLDARAIARPDPRDWPASFSVQASDDARDRVVAIRVRAHGPRVRDYRGAARLVAGGVDVTPPTEPLPSLAVDRLAMVRLRPGERGRLRLVLRAACAGAPAVVDPPRKTCVDRDGETIDVAVSPLEAGFDTPTASEVGSASRTPCPAGTRDGARCLEGGAFVLGESDVSVVPDPRLPLSPERVVRVATFAIDRDEVTVARYRDALARGFVAPEPPGASEGDVGADPKTACSYSEAPRGREGYALTCVSWPTARAFCKFMGGDLPGEAQWEYAATSAERTGKAQFPWGDEPPDCGRAVYGRLELAGFPGSCQERGLGPLPALVAGAPSAPGDVSAAGVRGLAGGVSEWTRDAASAYDAPCWRGSGQDPGCAGGADDARVVRGGSWGAPPIAVRGASRLSSSGTSALVGFRCVYPVTTAGAP